MHSASLRVSLAPPPLAMGNLRFIYTAPLYCRLKAAVVIDNACVHPAAQAHGHGLWPLAIQPYISQICRIKKGHWWMETIRSAGC